MISFDHSDLDLTPPEPPNLSHWLRHAVRQSPDAPAVQMGDMRLSYTDLLERTEALSSRLRAAQFAPGERIGIAAMRSIDTIIAILAVVDAGLCYVPLDLNYPPERLQAMLEDAAPRLVLGEPEALAQLRSAVGEFPTLANPSASRPMPHAAAEDLTYVLFTSGSTGRPKGVAMGAMPLRYLIHWHAEHPRLGQPARVLQFAPLSFDVHFQEIFSTLACGGTLVLVPEAQRRDPALLLAALVDNAVERMFVPYVALQMIADAARDRVPATLRDVVSAGEQLQVTPAIRSLFKRLPGAELHNHYGPTESHVVMAHELKGDPASWPEIPPIGLPLPHVRLALVNTQADPDGHTTGELLLGGDTLAHGYLGRPELTAERFRSDFEGLPDRWYVTGDLVRRDAAGVCTYLGRADQQLKVDGFRIEPGEIEIAIMAHDAVKDAVVTAPDLPGIGKQLVAHIVVRDGDAIDANALIGQLRGHLRSVVPEYMVPSRFVTVERMPTTPSGKIDRKALPLPAFETVTPTSTDPLVLVRTLWQELLGLPQIGDDQNLFDLGARSLLVMRFVTRLKDLGIRGVSVADVYDRPTAAGIASVMGGRPRARQQQRVASSHARDGSAGIAIIGMASRTPGAADVETFWQNLIAGREGIRHFALSDVDPSVPETVRNRPNFVPAHGMLDDIDRFDAAFFGISAREATMLDPQQRLMLEICASALEHAAIDPSRTEDRIGVYAGTGNNAYALALRQEQPELIQQYSEFATMLASEKDYVATRVANRLNLNGPALAIHTACSTSLVAVAQAWHALSSGQCDVALAGGVNVVVPQSGGYLHVEGGMESADGHCRPFDADATGTVFASGGGVVVLRRLEDALAAGDTIYGVIRGVGLNNDGGDKASFTAPSVSGQAGAIRMALEHADVNPRTIGYVEAHGTGTSLGDPIEVAALTRAWREDTDERQFSGIGSVKSNIGHLAAGAGVVGLIKATLALHREVIPGTLHFRRPNPEIDFAETPFKVIAHTTPWPRATEVRRAAVSSFGVGGTNAHLIVEEAPERRPTSVVAGKFVLPLSARTAEAALQRARDLADHLERNPDLPLADVAATLMRGRKPMAQRLSVVAEGAADAIRALRTLKSATTALHKPRLVFLFPGQGSQHPGMARALYDEVPAFRETLDRCLDIAGKSLGVDLHAWLVTADPADSAVAQALAETRYAQPALFSVSYALAAWLDSIGLKPDAMIGHSIGEYAAACHAGVLSLEDAMAVVLARGQAMFEQPRGAMLAVRSDAEALRPMLPSGVEIAGVNAPALTVVAGSHEAIDAFAQELESLDIGTTRLRVSHAFHSAAMDGALPLVAKAVERASLQAPRSTVYSCISGAPLQASEATAPGYWANQVRAPVQFSRAVEAELARGDAVFVEVGPSQALTSLLRQHRSPKGGVPRNVPLLGSAADPGNPAKHALSAVGALWCAGIDVAWPVAASAQRVPLPTYPFKGERYWFARRAQSVPAKEAAQPVDAASAVAAAHPDVPEPVIAVQPAEIAVKMSRIPILASELKRILSDVSGLPADEMTTEDSFVDMGLDSLSLTQATLEIERVFGVRLRFRRLLEDLDAIGKLTVYLDGEMPADKFAPAPIVAAVAAPAPVAPPAAPATAQAVVAASAVPVAMMHAVPSPMPLLEAGATAMSQLVQQQIQLMSQQLAVLSGQSMPASLPPLVATASSPPPAHAGAPAMQAAPAPAPAPTPPAAADTSSQLAQPTINTLVEKPFGASPRLTLEAKQDFTPGQRQWLDDFIVRYNARTGKSKSFSQQHRKVMADPRVVTGFNPLWKDLVYPIVVDRSSGASLWDLDGNEYIDLLSCFGGNILGYQPASVMEAMTRQLQLGLEVGPQHPLAADVAKLISEFTGMERVAFCNTGSEAVMGAMRIARTTTGRKTIAIFSNSYHGIFDEVIVRGTKQLRSLSAAPGILANAVENILVLDWNSEDSLRVLRERGSELAAIMTEPIQNKYPTVQPRAFVQALREIADKAGCALIFDEVVTGFRVAPGGAQEFYGVRADISTYGKVIGGGLPFAAIAGNSRWLDSLDGGQWQYGDDSYPEAGVTYFAGTFVRHPLALAAAHATLLHIKKGGREFYRNLNDRTQRLVERLNAAFAMSGAPVTAVHCASLWRLQWDDNQKFVSLFYYLTRYHGLHLYEQFGHFVTEGMTDAHTDRIFQVFTSAMDELMRIGLITPRPGSPIPRGRVNGSGTRTPRSEAQLSPGQTERWLAANFDINARRALNESLLLELEGDADLDALEAALLDVMKRHEAFRIAFDTAEPQQSIAASVELDVHRVDLSADADPQAALDKFCEEASGIVFDLDVPPLARVSLVKLGSKRTAVHLVVSHLIFDGWASPVFVQDLAVAYRARCGGSPALWTSDAESPLAFSDAEQQRWSGVQGREAAEYWKHEMQSPPAVFSLGDLEPQTPRSFRGDTLRRAIDGRLLQDLTQLSRKHKSTMFQVLLAGVTEMVYRLSGREEFVISIPYASQSLERHGPLIADGVLDLPVRLQRKPADGFQAVLERVKTKVMDALEQPLATQSSVARSVGVTSVGSRPPLTSVFFNMNPRLDVNGFEPLRAEIRECRKLGLLSEVIFNFYEKAGEITLDLHYSTEFYSAKRAAEVSDALMAVLREAVGGAVSQGVTPAVPNAKAATALSEPAVKPETKSGVSTLSSSDLEKLARWNATETPYETGLRLGDLIRRTVERSPNAVAIRFEGRDVSFAELDGMAWSLARKLRESGVVPGTLVGVCLDRSVELVVALVGVTYSGGAYVPLDPAYPAERLTNMCEDAKMSVVVTRAKELASTGAAIPADIRKILIEDLPNETGSTAGNELVGASTDPAYVIFTSGSTGRPKGAMNAHAGIVNRLQWMQQEYHLTPADRVMQKTPYSFDVSVWEFYWPLLTGSTIVVARPDGHRDADYIAQLIEDEKVTVLHFVPSMLRLFLESPRGEQCRSLRLVVCSGEALPIDAVDKFFENLPTCKLGNLYGPTEAAVDVTCWNCAQGDPRRIVPIGRPIANTKMYVLDEKLELLPPGHEGELYIGGIQVGMGYVSRPDLTNERFLPDPFIRGGRMYKTGDVGRWLDDGVIEYLGRADHQVKIRGFRIELGEIESQLMASQLVARCVVVARDFGDGDMRLIAYIVPRGMMPEAAALKALLGKSLPEYMVPQVFVAMGDIPLLPNGKIDRKALPAPTGPVLASSPQARETTDDPLVGQVAALMADLLKVPAIGADENFFELGGHSLLAARLSTRLAESGYPRPGLRIVFEAPTPRRLAAWLVENGNEPKTNQTAEAARGIPHLAVQDTAPLSLMQQRMWFLENLQPGTNVNNSPSAHVLTGDLDPVAFDRAFRDVIRRQPALRTSFETAHGQVQQRISDDIEYSLLPLTDLRSVPAGERRQRLDSLIDELVSPAFDLFETPMFRAKLYRIEDDVHVFFFMPHHLIWDAWSFDILYEDMSALYEAHRLGRQPALSPLKVTYADFAAWQLDWMQGEELARQTQKWLRLLTPLPAPLELPCSLPRPAEMTGRGDSFQFVLEGESLTRLQQLAKRQGTTLYVTVLALHALVLAQASGQRDFCIGTPVRGRESSELEPLMGFFVNMLPLRLTLTDESTLIEWIQKVHEEVRDSFEAPDVPFEHLVRLLNPPRDHSRAAIHQASFSYQDVRERTRNWGNLVHDRLPTAMGGASQDLSLWCVLTNDNLEFVYTYNTDIMVEADARLLAKRLEMLISRATDNPEAMLNSLLPLAPEEHEQLVEWNSTAREFDLGTTLPALFAQRGASVAISQPGVARLTYQQLDRQSNQLARALRALGVGRGHLVGICMERSCNMVVAQQAILKAGAGYVPLDPAYPADRLRYMTDDSGIEVMVCDQATRSSLNWPLDRLISVDAEDSPVKAFPTSALAPEKPLDARPEDPAYVIYTSGSTGKPKGVVVPHRSVVNFLRSMATQPGMSSADRIVAVTTLSFDIAVLELMLPLLVGAEIILADREVVQDATELRNLVEMSGATMMQATPSTWRQLIEAGWQGSPTFKALIGGEALPPDLAKTLLARTGQLWNMYGPTETTVWSTCWQVVPGDRQISIGKPIANTQVHVLDASMRPAPIGVSGEIWIGGDGVASGYLNRPELTAERFVTDPFRRIPGALLYRTGDRGRWCHDGLLQHEGRVDFQVKVRGHRIELGEIEATLGAHPAVSQCTVIVREDVPGDQRLVAYVVPRETEIDTQSLREYARLALPAYMVPQLVEPIAKLPLLPNGKIDRGSLPAPATSSSHEDRAADTSYVAPRSAIEQSIAAIWKRVLGVDRVGATDNFFDLGGHSLLAMSAVTQMRSELHLSVDVRRLIFESLAQVAQAAKSQTAPAETELRGVVAVGADASGAPRLWSSLKKHLRA